MRMVVDSNYLRAPEFETYLSKNKHNFAVLPDFAAKEAHKNDSIFGVIKTLKIACSYPRQILVLKNTTQILGLKFDGAGLQKRLISKQQTDDFYKFSKLVHLGQEGDRAIETALQKHHQQAVAEIDSMLQGASLIKGQLGVLSNRFTKEERKALRLGLPYTKGMKDKLVTLVLEVTRELIRSSPRTVTFKHVRDVKNSFQFRLALGLFLLDVWWGISGGAPGARHETIRNDMVDLYFITYASYFDGLLSHEAKQMQIYKQMCHHLHYTFP